MYYLLKSEPLGYSFADLKKNKQTVWDGVSNPVALKNLRAMQKGDAVVIYHTGDEKRVVGTAEVVSVEGAEVKIRAGAELARPRTLAEIKAHKLFADSPLVRQGRLSVVPLTKQQYEWLVGA